ncbi:DUF4876 domain-containing protein [Chitinophaga horti]|uniref:DUF4876 domain-containing protein n=1 Tax=Chitinophaga horti TaxID=2920382 RepID=A0ABY6J478_9BACT|nr:DUF4876 domain-containing protein [Chitinophaga horti]UYQ94475.1 DUF4876 domain-containing protein [Chitinophaga horti]
MKYIKQLIAALSIPVLLAGCEKINDALDAEKVGAYTVSVTASTEMSGVATEGLKVVFENFAEGFRLEAELGAGATPIKGLIPGMYSINVSGRVEGADGETYYLNGSKINYAIFKNNEQLEISVSGLKVSPLVFSEIFFAGTNPFYFRNQFYEIYNNSDKVIYLDGLCFANLMPSAVTTNMPTWPATDGNQYAYAERIWKIPGNGTEYPLQPGESFSIAQWAANHQLPQYSPASPINCFPAEFEFNMNNPNFPDQPAVDMTHVFYNASASKGTLPQYLVSVFGGAYVIFRVPAGETYDPVNNAELRTRNLANATATQQYAKIPIRYILDAVEAGNNQNSIANKRVPSVLDAGMTYVGATYNSQGVARKVGAVNADGTPIYTDTNNSTDDFERGVVPQFRRHGAKMPFWNHMN